MRVKLSDLYDIGSSKRVFQSEWRKSGVPFYRAREIAKLSIDGYVDNELFIDEDLYLEYIDKYGKPEAGDVMVTGVGTLGVCYVVKQEDRFYFKDGNILWFKQKAKDRILPEYLVKAFDSKDVKEFIDKNSSGTTVGTFTIQTAKKMEISLPSIEEQRNIIQKITKIESVIKQRRQELQLLDDLIKARFVELFGDPDNNEKSWDIDKMEHLCEVGSSKRIYQNEQSMEGAPFLRISDLVNRIDTGSKKCDSYIPIEKFAELKEQGLVPRPGDILLTARGTLGRCYIVQSDDEFYFQDGMITWLSNYDRRITALYISYLFEMPGFRKQIDALQAGSTVAYMSISMTKKLNIIVPPIELQNQFADFVKQVDKSKVIKLSN